jgi:hypothetical protein
MHCSYCGHITMIGMKRRYNVTSLVTISWAAADAFTIRLKKYFHIRSATISLSSDIIINETMQNTKSSLLTPADWMQKPNWLSYRDSVACLEISASPLNCLHIVSVILDSMTDLVKIHRCCHFQLCLPLLDYRCLHHSERTNAGWATSNIWGIRNEKPARCGEKVHQWCPSIWK